MIQVTSAQFSNSKFTKFVQQSPLRDAQRNASAGPVNKKGQVFGLAFFVATRAHSFVSPCDGASQHLWGRSMKLEGFTTKALVVRADERRLSGARLIMSVPLTNF
jgi:hypothetical protein